MRFFRDLAALAALAACDAVTSHAAAVGGNGFEISINTESDDPRTPVALTGDRLLASTVKISQSRLHRHPFHRLIPDHRGRFVFAYTIEVQPAPGPGRFFIRLLPLDQDFETRVRSEAWFPADSPLTVSGRLTTFSRSKDLGLVKAGDEVRIELFRNPDSGGKVEDVLKMAEHPLARPWPHLPRQGQDLPLRFTEIRVFVNGRDETSPESTLSVAGKAILIALRPHGRFIFARSPVPGYPFQFAARVEGKRLTLPWRGSVYEFVSNDEIAPAASEPFSLWALVLPSDPADPLSEVAAAGDPAKLLPRKPAAAGQ